MKHHPEVLTLLLKRFKFDNFYKNYVKVRCSVDVPCTLQIPEDETYELYGFVDHFGDLRGGHYTATIKDDERWYKFDDTIVTRLPDNQPIQMDNIMKSSSAYLVFYRKKTVKVTDISQDIKEGSANGGSQSDTSHTRKRIKDEEAAGGDCYTVDKQENEEKRRVDDQEGKQEQDSVCLDRQRNEKLVKDVKVEKKSTTGADEREKASVNQKLKIYDLVHFYGNMSNNQGISNTSPTRHEQRREEKRDVKEDKKQMTREYKYAQVGDTSMTHQDSRKLGDVREEQRSRRNSLVENRTANDFRQNKPNDEQEGKQEISGKLNVSSRYLVEKEGEKSDGKGNRQRKIGDNECAQRRGTSGSHGSEGVEDKPQEQLEKEIGHKDVCVETRIKVAENVMEGGGRPNEVQTTHSSIQNSNINMRTETSAETFGLNLRSDDKSDDKQLSDDKSKDIRKFDPNEDELNTLTERVRGLKLNDSLLPGGRRGKLDK
ncbi:myb-like protein X [Thunnus thynnus]|uniref:myb-like protein X n=1 Tax=Thunnus thynnus TaxID=8237 RepID=UPI003526FB6E